MYIDSKNKKWRCCQNLICLKRPLQLSLYPFTLNTHTTRLWNLNIFTILECAPSDHSLACDALKICLISQNSRMQNTNLYHPTNEESVLSITISKSQQYVKSTWDYFQELPPETISMIRVENLIVLVLSWFNLIHLFVSISISVATTSLIKNSIISM